MVQTVFLKTDPVSFNTLTCAVITFFTLFILLQKLLDQILHRNSSWTPDNGWQNNRWIKWTLTFDSALWTQTSCLQMSVKPCSFSHVRAFKLQCATSVFWDKKIQGNLSRTQKVVQQYLALLWRFLQSLQRLFCPSTLKKTFVYPWGKKVLEDQRSFVEWPSWFEISVDLSLWKTAAYLQDSGVLVGLAVCNYKQRWSKRTKSTSCFCCNLKSSCIHTPSDPFDATSKTGDVSCLSCFHLIANCLSSHNEIQSNPSL